MAATPRRSRSGRIASARGCSRLPRPCSPASGFADATAEAIAREAGMSKATFYEHFGNKEECILALFDAAIDVVIEGIAQAARDHGGDTPEGRVGASVRAFLEVIDAFPDQAQTLLVEIIGAGPRAAERRDAALARVADYIDEANKADAEAGVVDRLASPHDAFAIVGAIVELASRQLRTKEPADIRELEPVIGRLVLGLVGAAPPRASAV